MRVDLVAWRVLRRNDADLALTWYYFEQPRDIPRLLQLNG